jgi:hypothetical protein
MGRKPISTETRSALPHRTFMNHLTDELCSPLSSLFPDKDAPSQGCLELEPSDNIFAWWMRCITTEVVIWRWCGHVRWWIGILIFGDIWGREEKPGLPYWICEEDASYLCFQESHDFLYESHPRFPCMNLDFIRQNHESLMWLTVVDQEQVNCQFLEPGFVVKYWPEDYVKAAM